MPLVERPTYLDINSGQTRDAELLDPEDGNVPMHTPVHRHMGRFFSALGGAILGATAVYVVTKGLDRLTSGIMDPPESDTVDLKVED